MSSFRIKFVLSDKTVIGYLPKEGKDLSKDKEEARIHCGSPDQENITEASIFIEDFLYKKFHYKTHEIETLGIKIEFETVSDPTT